MRHLCFIMLYFWLLAVDFVDLLDGRSLRHSMCMVIVIIISCDILTIVAKLPVDS